MKTLDAVIGKWFIQCIPEDGLRRNECAFEPITGSNCNLEQSFREGIILEAEPGKP